MCLLIIIFMCLSISSRSSGRIMCILGSSFIRGSVGIGLTRFFILNLWRFIYIILCVHLEFQSSICRIIRHLHFSTPFSHQSLHLFCCSLIPRLTHHPWLYLYTLHLFAISSLPATHLTI